MRTACLLAALVACLLFAAPALATPSCASEAWLGAWAAPPSDASRGTQLSDLFDASLNPKLPLHDATVRAMLTPTFGGSVVRLRLSNRFGAGPLTLARTALATRRVGASTVPATSTPLTFGGRQAVTVAPGRDVVSDPARFSVRAFGTVAVSAHVRGPGAKPTEHHLARQTSYATLPGAGDHVGDAHGTAFLLATTSRPFVTGLDVMAPRSAAAVVALGDSLTDGLQARPPGILELRTGIDADARWPDVLARRLRSRGRPMSVLNAGISGNRVLRDATDGGYADTNGPSALGRLDADVLGQAGVRTAIVWEGINDLALAPSATPAQLVAGYEELIGRLHRAGHRVLHATLTPAGGAEGEHGTPATEAKRQAVNAWIRATSPADEVLDLDAVVRDPANHARLRPAHDAGDRLHLSTAGYTAVGDAIALGSLGEGLCARPLRLTLSPRRVRTGQRVRLALRVRSHLGAPVRGALVRVAERRARTDARGRARIRLRFARRGRVTVVATAAGSQRAIAHIRVTGR